jgi:alcohol dehydrogenase
VGDWLQVTSHRGAMPRRCVRLEDAEELLATVADERDGVSPVHGMLTP